MSPSCKDGLDFRLGITMEKFPCVAYSIKLFFFKIWLFQLLWVKTKYCFIKNNTKKKIFLLEVITYETVLVCSSVTCYWIELVSIRESQSTLQCSSVHHSSSLPLLFCRFILRKIVIKHLVKEMKAIFLFYIVFRFARQQN